jgi:hypothetical protein
LKIFKAVDVEDDFEIDMNKFAENTLNKIMEESSNLFTEVEDGIKKATEKIPKLKKDPDAPKAAVNAYIMFSRDNRDDVKSENPDLKATEITKKLADMWKGSDAELKQEYKEKAEQDKERYAKELENYVPKEGFQNPKEKKSKKVKKSGPSKPLNAYMWFCKDKREELKGKGFNNTEILREMGRLWKELSDKNKKIYTKKAEDDKERYEEEMKNYVPTEEKAEVETKKTKKGKKASNAPKRPLGAFMLFRKDKYQQVKEENPDKKKYTDQAAKLLSDFKNSEIVNSENDSVIVSSESDENDGEDREDGEDGEELDIPSTGTPIKCMPIIVSDEKFAKMKEEEAKKQKEEKKKHKEEKKKEEKKKHKEEKKKSKKSKKDESDDEEILSDDE